MGIPESKRYKQIFYDYYPGVLRKLAALLRDERLAEDLAQETFLKLYRQPPDNLDAPGAWLHRVATRLAYDHMDKAARDRRLTEKQERELAASVGASPSGEAELMRRLDQEEVRQWLDGLPERDRKALLLRYSGYSYAEIAEELSMRPPLVGTMLARATDKLRRCAEQAGADGGKSAGPAPGSRERRVDASPEAGYRSRLELH
ncbi:sigma-70 family RNA polymerase sigma factor [Paenibacillus albicereus]|uniref:Sigma-70 family RNA polymerase sigma factor n=1 Tax=Paenibacillus albicereus TaxID=2726185 RepID=A0A6H2GT33_9BACL|nr:sigma-70 family RNA polymerase sigma factor [Paenibacillus albicereus]QJC50591.1 sigma-70 family RNA polymerase sigma factor [Paenibacillus albicereus]